MEKVDFKNLPDEARDAADFLKSHLTRVQVKGHQLLVEGARHREVKLLLHKFLRHKGLEGYRVLSLSGVIEIVPEHQTSAHGAASRSGGGTVPPVAATMPYYFPSGGPIPMEKKVRKRRKS